MKRGNCGTCGPIGSLVLDIMENKKSNFKINELQKPIEHVQVEKIVNH